MGEEFTVINSIPTFEEAVLYQKQIEKINENTKWFVVPIPQAIFGIAFWSLVTAGQDMDMSIQKALFKIIAVSGVALGVRVFYAIMKKTKLMDKWKEKYGDAKLEDIVGIRDVHGKPPKFIITGWYGLTLEDEDLLKNGPVIGTEYYDKRETNEGGKKL